MLSRLVLNNDADIHRSVKKGDKKFRKRLKGKIATSAIFFASKFVQRVRLIGLSAVPVSYQYATSILPVSTSPAGK